MIHPTNAPAKRTTASLLFIGMLACALFAQDSELKTQTVKQETAGQKRSLDLQSIQVTAPADATKPSGEAASVSMPLDVPPGNLPDDSSLRSNLQQAESPAGKTLLHTTGASMQNVQQPVEAGSAAPAGREDCTDCLLNSVQSKEDAPETAAAGDDSTQFELIATRAYLRTAPNSGTVVDNPVTGQQYFVHFDWSAAFSTPQDVTLRILLNDNVLCSGTLNAVTSNSFVTTCAAAVTWPAGTNTIAGKLDPDNLIAETNENDNGASKTLVSTPPPPAELVADRVFLRTGPNSGPEVENPITGQRYFVHFNWRNTGAAATGFRFNLRLNNVELCAYNGNAAANSSHNSWCTDPVTWPADTNAIQGVLDFQNVIPEVSENNNTASKILISAPPLLADLVADRVFLRTGPNSGPEVENPIIGQPYFVHFNWRNTGRAASGFRFNLRFNNIELCAYNGNAAANSSHNSWCTEPVTWPAGTNAIQGVLDFENVIAEISENNNTAGKTLVSIPPPLADFVADRVFLRTGPNSGPEVGNPITGQQYFVHFNWRNIGLAASGFRFNLRLNNVELCAYNGNAAANSSHNSWCTDPVTWPADTNAIQGVLDFQNVVPEINETNNTAGKTLISLPPLPDLAADRMFLRTGPNSGLEVDAPIPGQSYFVHFEWRNAGGATDTFLLQIKLNQAVQCSGKLTASANSSNVSWCSTAVVWPEADSVAVDGLLDVNNAIVESNEGNNNVRFTFVDFDSDLQKSPGAISKNAGAVPTSLNLYQSYPNPFGGRSQELETVIRFDLPGSEPAPVELVVYNVTGQLVRRLISGERKPGAHETLWDGKDDWGNAVPSGTYLYRLKVGNRIESKQLTVVR
jgi:subtilase family serine protease